MEGRLFAVQLGLVLSLLVVLNIDYNEAIIFKLTNAVCESVNKSWVDFSTCRLKAVARNKIIFNMDVTVFVPAHRIDARIECLKKASGYKPWLFNTTLDGCKFFRQVYNPFVILIFNQIREFTNINHTCPYMGLHSVKGLYLRPELLNNLPMPSGEYMLRGTWYFHGQHVANTNFYFEYVEDLKNS